MKKLSTTRFGKIEIDETKIINFAEGIPAFDAEKEFVIIPYSQDAPFFFLQSVKTPDLAFLMANPFVFFEDYEFTINDESLQKLKLKDQKDLLIYCLLTIPESNIKKATANLLAPIIINQVNHQGMQLILENSPYNTRHLLINKKNTGDDK